MFSGQCPRNLGELLMIGRIGAAGCQSLTLPNPTRIDSPWA